jgi:KUP system potassium uptake protein
MNPTPETTPLALRANVEHNHALHQDVLIVSVVTEPVPHVPRHERLVFDDLGYADDGLSHVTAHFGFMDATDIPGTLRLEGSGPECQIDPDTATYFLSKITIVPTRAPGMRRWRKRLFVAIARNASDPVEYFNLPGDRTLFTGSHIEF